MAAIFSTLAWKESHILSLLLARHGAWQGSANSSFLFHLVRLLLPPANFAWSPPCATSARQIVCVNKLPVEAMAIRNATGVHVGPADALVGALSGTFQDAAAGATLSHLILPTYSVDGWNIVFSSANARFFFAFFPFQVNSLKKSALRPT
jgi:hypothetical protein